MICQSCNGTDDVIDFNIGDQEFILCVKCRFKFLTAAKGTETKMPGRPLIGVTGKVSLTMPQETWDWFEFKANGNRSELIRYLISRERSSSEREWSNDAALRYALLAAKNLGYTSEQLEQLAGMIRSLFDTMTIEEAVEADIKFL